jgi:PII-like signaling protein
MHGLPGERTLLRIAVNSADRADGRPVYEAIVARLRERGFAGATVLPCIMGFGASGRVYSEMNEITSFGMPVIVEAVDTEERIMGVLPELDHMIKGGVITLERAQVIVYRGPDGSDTPGQTPNVREG